MTSSRCLSLFILLMIGVNSTLTRRSSKIRQSSTSPVERRVHTESERGSKAGRVIIPNKERPEVLNHFDEDVEDTYYPPTEVDENEEMEEPKEAPGFQRNAIMIGLAMSSLAVGVILYSLYLSKQKH